MPNGLRGFLVNTSSDYSSSNQEVFIESSATEVYFESYNAIYFDLKN